MIYDFNTKEMKKSNDNSKVLSFLYGTFFGRIILKLLTKKYVTLIYAKYLDSRFSIPKIKRFIKKNSIDMSEYVPCKYTSFNNFFYRKIKDESRFINDGLISVCDSKLSVYSINDDLVLDIKGSSYTIDELIDDKCDRKYKYALVFRLCVDDYHRYIFPDDGVVYSSKYIPGRLHTVRPIALRTTKVFKENSRCVSFLKCKELGDVCYIEVGAMMVGKIVNNNVHSFRKGDEKGHFEFGGSTIIMLIGDFKIDDIFLSNTRDDIETAVKLGNRIGTIK